MKSGTKLKLVIRKLPFSLNEDAFFSSIERYKDSYSWALFCPGKTGSKRSVHARAYLEFKSIEGLYEFASKFEGHVFLDSKGCEFRAEVEYAPYQRVPRTRRTADSRQGTIEKDSDYIQFLESLKVSAEVLPSAEVQMDIRDAEQKAAAAANGGIIPHKTTPLLEHLREKWAAKTQRPKDKDIKRRKDRDSGDENRKRRGAAAMDLDGGDNPSEAASGLEDAAGHAGHARSAGSGPGAADQDVPRYVKRGSLDSHSASNRGQRWQSKNISSSDGSGKGSTTTRENSAETTSKASSGRTSGSSKGSRHAAEANDQSKKHADKTNVASGTRDEGQETIQGSKANSNSARLRNKDRPDRPVWSIGRRKDKDDGSARSKEAAPAAAAEAIPGIGSGSGDQKQGSG